MKLLNPYSRDRGRTTTLVTRHLVVVLLSATFVAARSAAVQESRDEPLLRVEPFSESVASRARRAEMVRTPGEVARNVRFVFVRSLSLRVTAEDIENKLRKHPDFQRLGMLITRQETDADLVLEVRRSVLTKFVFTAVDPETLILVASGKLSSLGGTVDDKVAKRFMKQIVALRAGP